MAQLISSRDIHKSRKEHTCSWCGDIIPKGSSYHDDLCKEDGEVYHWKQHTECYKVINELWSWIDPWDNELDSSDFDYNITEFFHDYMCPRCSFYNICSEADFESDITRADCPVPDTFKMVAEIAEVLESHHFTNCTNKCKRSHRWKLIPKGTYVIVCERTGTELYEGSYTDCLCHYDGCENHYGDCIILKKDDGND